MRRECRKNAQALFFSFTIVNLSAVADGDPHLFARRHLTHLFGDFDSLGGGSFLSRLLLFLLRLRLGGNHRNVRCECRRASRILISRVSDRLRCIHADLYRRTVKGVLRHLLRLNVLELWRVHIDCRSGIAQFAYVHSFVTAVGIGIDGSIHLLRLLLFLLNDSLRLFVVITESYGILPDRRGIRLSDKRVVYRLIGRLRNRLRKRPARSRRS